MKIDLVTIGSNPPEWVKTGFYEYQKRLPQHLDLAITELPLAKRSKNADIERLKQEEGEAILSKIKADDWVIALEIGGKAYTTEALAGQLEQWQINATPLKLIIGGPNGLSKPCQDRANQHWSISNLTLPHQLVRIVVAEQLYRAHTVLSGHPYHK